VSNKYVVVDLETTGNSPKKGDRIIQIAAVVVENDVIMEQFSTLINPEREIPLFIEELTGLSDEMVSQAPTFAEIAPRVLALLDEAYFVAHNVLFDLSFLQEELVEAGYEGFLGPVLDTVEMARFLFPSADGYKLNDLAVQEGLDHDRPHQADSDAYVTAELFIILLKKLQSLPRLTLTQLLKHSHGLKSDISLLLEDLVVEKEQTIDEAPYTLELHRGILLTPLTEPDENIQRPSLDYPEDEADKEQLFQKAFEQFEKRPGQFQMMDTVFRAFSAHRHALIEAGTGVGKSMAYLLPAAILTSQLKETIVISTYTTQLQEQLMKKDLPLLQKMLPYPIKAVLLKGRTHYIDITKFVHSLKVEDDNYDISLSKMQILIWLMETETGDRDELNLSSGGSLFWEKISHDHNFDQHKSWSPYDFYYRARNAAQSADFVITNHSFLLVDLISENAILPEFGYCILDEGHHFEKAASKYFGHSLDYLQVRMLLSQFGQYEEKAFQYQLDKLLSEKIPELRPDSLHSFEVNQLFNQLVYEVDEFFKTVAILATKKVRKPTGSNRVTYRLSDGESSMEWMAVKACGERMLFVLKDLMEYIEKSVTALQNAMLTANEKVVISGLLAFHKKLQHLCEMLRKIILVQEEEFVTWIEMDVRAAQNATTIYTQPISISSSLKEHFFDKKKSVVLTSATLSVKNSFDYIRRELGLDAFDCETERIDSPFDYENQVQLIVQTDLPEVNAVPVDEYVAAISEHIISIAEATKGRMLILFTSYDMLKRTYTLLKESGLLDDYVLIGQGITGGSRTRLTRSFQRFEKAILLGTNSFWEGIDIPGEDLSCLIMVRLPFSAPNEPITDAKSQLIKRNGGNAFSDYSLPEAVIRFKQGFGRLIRSSEDRGLVVVFDKRLYTTTYGKAFLQSIPKVPLKKLDINETLDLIHEWM